MALTIPSSRLGTASLGLVAQGLGGGTPAFAFTILSPDLVATSQASGPQVDAWGPTLLLVGSPCMGK